MTDSFPRQYARTQRLTLGEPRNISISRDGNLVAFLRSTSGSDPVNRLWRYDRTTGAESIVADPLALLATADTNLPIEERRRRERAREGAGGITSFATDGSGTAVAFALSGRLFVAGLATAMSRELVVTGPVFDPRPDPLSRRVAYVRNGTLRIANLNGTNWEIAADDDPDITWGLAEFIAAEEMNRQRGYWWAPDGEHLVVARVDNRPVQQWWLSDPTNPAQDPTRVRYPVAGTPNADVQLFVVDLDGGKHEIIWDRSLFPYVNAVNWAAQGLVIAVQSRDQRHVEYRMVDPSTGATTLRLADTDARWIEITPGFPNFCTDGRLITCADREGARRLLIEGEPITPKMMQVRSLLSVSGDELLFTANYLVDPIHQQVWRLSNGKLDRISLGDGVHTAVRGGRTIVLRSSTMDRDGAVTTFHDGQGRINSFAETPLVRTNVTIHQAGDRSLVTAVLLPTGASPDVKLPVLLDPYGGPHSQRVVAARASYYTSQWFADQGYAVVITDGRGTPGRGSVWERSVTGDLAQPVLDDQIDALLDIAEDFPQMDLARVGIRGWSFGGYLAALAVIRRPDIFHCAIAGAPVTDWRLYDTHYTERYLGDPTLDAGPYERTSLLTEARNLTRPLLLIHGLSDDNVYAAHTLQLSRALLEAGRPHTFLPLSGVSHMTPQEEVAENLLKVQLAFLDQHLRP